MRSALVYSSLLLLVVVEGCGLANGFSEGAIQSPFAGVFGGGGPAEGTPCTEDNECLPSELICDYADQQTSDRTCTDAAVWAWCNEATSLGLREEHGPLLWNSVISSSGGVVALCVEVDVDYYDPDDDFPVGHDDVLDALNANSNAGLATTVTDVNVHDSYETEGHLTVTVCGGTSAPTRVALSAQDSSDHRSNASCAE